MECAGLAAVAQFRNVDFAQFFYVTDTLDGPEWDEGILPQGGAGLTDICFRAAVETLAIVKRSGISQREGIVLSSTKLKGVGYETLRYRILSFSSCSFLLLCLSIS